MPRKATAKEKQQAPPQEETMKRPRRQSAKKDGATPSAGSGGPIRARRSSTAAQTAASVADATRGTRSSSRSQGSNRQNSSDRKSTSRETSLEPAEPRISRRIIKKINYQESEGEEEEAQVAKPVENVEEEDYNAEDDVENDSDSRESARNKQKGKVKSPPSRSRGRPARTKATKVETPPVKSSPGRGRRPKTEKKSTGENEGDFVAPSRRGRYAENAEEETGDKNVEKVRASSRGTRARPTRQAAMPRTPSQRPTRTSRRQQNLDESKEEEEEEEEEEDEEEEQEEEEEKNEKNPEDKKDDVDSPPAKKKMDSDEASNTNEKSAGDSSAKKRKSEEEPELKKEKRLKLDESEKIDEEEEGESNEGDSEDEEEPMEVDEVDDSKESKPTSGPSELTNKEMTPKPDSKSPTKEESKGSEKTADKDKESTEKKDAQADTVEVPVKVVQNTEPIAIKDSVPDKKVDSVPETKPKPAQTSEAKSVITQVPSTPKPGTGTNLQNAKDQPLALTPEKKKIEQSAGDEKGKPPPVVPEEKKPVNISGGEPVIKPPSNPVTASLPESKNLQEHDAKPKELHPHIVSRPVESVRCEGGTFNGCEPPPEKVVPSSNPDVSLNLSQPRVPPPSNVVGNAANTCISNSFGSAPANPEKQPEGKLGANGVHYNQNMGPKPRGRKYVAAGNIKEDEKLAYRDRTFSCVSHNLGGDFMQAEKLLPELKSQLSEIICLQEVSEEIFRSHLKSSFESLGYRLLFNVPFGQKTGLATLYKANIFTVKNHQGANLKDIIAKDLDASGSSREEKMAVIEHLKNCGRMLLTHLMFNGRHLIVANVSVPPTDLGAHTLQMSCVARETLNALEGTARPLIICGTFNMQENNAAYQLLRDGYLSNDMIELLQSKKDITVPGRENTALVNLLWKSFQHSAAALNSCYASVMGSELKVHGQSTTRPDLMWYSSDCLKVFGVLGDVESSEPATSTHLLLKADLAFSV